ncbi:MAG TPA: nuclear transport factor 2 family protein [Polyangiaceae bacterium]|nr:nuclear transport factor 2 family protein [Polyangiaceae bacterium]
MSNELKRVWERYVSSWQAGSLPEKLAIFETCLTRDCVYTDPLVTARGWSELSRYMLELQQNVPGVHFVTEQFLAHGAQSAARWQMLDGRGVKLGEGISYAEYDASQRLTQMKGFFELPPSTPAT